MVEVDVGGRRRGGRRRRPCWCMWPPPRAGRAQAATAQELPGIGSGDSGVASFRCLRFVRDEPSQSGSTCPGHSGCQAVSQEHFHALVLQEDCGRKHLQVGEQASTHMYSEERKEDAAPPAFAFAGEGLSLLVKSSRKRSPVSAKESPRKVSSSPAAASPASGNKRKKAREEILSRSQCRSLLRLLLLLLLRRRRRWRRWTSTP